MIEAQQTEDKERARLDSGLDAEHINAHDPHWYQNMNRSRRHHTLQRLFAVAVSMALMLASVIGAHGHAFAHSPGSGHGHRHSGLVEQVSQVEQTFQIAPDILTAVDADHQNTNDKSHSGCTDFICHGGLAILASGLVALTFAQRVENLPWTSQVACRRGVFSLDRPPKIFVLA